MRCGEAREALSALLDGETSPVSLRAAQRHVEWCEECRAWQDAAQRIDHVLRTQAAMPTPDLTERVLAAVHADQRAVAARRRRHLGLRIALGCVALAQLALALPGLFSWYASATHGNGVHPGQSAACDIAIGIGVLLAARYPDRARALVPVVGVLAGFLLITTGIDLYTGATTLLRELSHGLAAVQAGLLWALSRRWDRQPPAPARPVTA